MRNPSPSCCMGRRSADHQPGVIGGGRHHRPGPSWPAPLQSRRRVVICMAAVQARSLNAYAGPRPVGGGVLKHRQPAADDSCGVAGKSRRAAPLGTAR
jgi:hypothetical protein